LALDVRQNGLKRLEVSMNVANDGFQRRPAFGPSDTVGRPNLLAPSICSIVNGSHVGR
jgi:hypothetical protein